MATNEPMSEQTLTMIRELLADDGRQWGDYSPQELYRVGWSAELLLVEVDRLRAREQALEAENAAAIDELEWQRDINQQLGAENEQKQAQIDAMRPLVEMLAHGGVAYEADGSACQCAFCLDYTIGSDDELMQHHPDCPVAQARAFVAAHPATAGEAESEGEAVESEPVAGVTFADTDGNDPDAYDEAESECE